MCDLQAFFGENDQRESHGVVDGLAFGDRGRGTAAFQMHGHKMDFLRRLAQQVGRPLQHVTVRSAVKPEAADAMLICQLIGNSVERSNVWDGPVKRRIEDDIERDFPQLVADRLD